MLSLQILHDHRDALAAADARRGQPVLRFAAPQFVQQRNHQPRAGRSQRMAQRNRAAVHVDLVAIEAQALFRPPDTVRRRLRSLRSGRCRPASARLSSAPVRVAGTGPLAHDLGIDTGDAPAHDASHRLQAALFRLGERHHHDGRAAIDDAAGVAGSDGPVLAERRLSAWPDLPSWFQDADDRLCRTSLPWARPCDSSAATGVISSARRQAFCAAPAFCCDCSANSSMCSRVMPCCSA